jgi:hypothetical protein
VKQETDKLFPKLAHKVQEEWTTLKGETSELSRWIKRVIEGGLPSLEKHGIKGWSEDSNAQTIDDLVCFLTFGPNCSKYDYKHWGQEQAPLEFREFKGTSTAQYAKRWDGGGIIKGTVTMVMDIDRGNPMVSELMGRIRKANKKVKSPITKEPSITSESGRIKISLRFIKKKRTRYLKMINECKSREQLRNTKIDESVEGCPQRAVNRRRSHPRKRLVWICCNEPDL